MSYKFPRNSVAMLAFLGGLAALSSLSIDMAVPAFAEMEQVFGVAKGRGAETLSYFMIGFAVSPLFCGPLADRFGRKLILLYGLVLFCIGAYAVNFAPTYPVLLFFRLVQGVGAGLSVALPIAIVRDIIDDPDVSRSYQGRINVFVFVSPMIAPAIGAVIAYVFGWRGINTLQGIAGTIVLLATFFFFEETLPKERRQSLHPGNVLRNYGKVLKNPLFLSATIMYSSGYAAAFTYIGGSALIMMQYYGFTSGEYSALYCIHAAGSIGGSLLCSHLSLKHVSPLAQLRLGMYLRLVMGIFLVAAAYFAITGPWQIAIACGFISVTLGLTAPNSIHEAMRTLPDVVGSATGMMRCWQMAAGGIATWFVSALADGKPELGIWALNVCMMGWIVVALFGFTFWRITCWREAKRNAMNQEAIGANSEDHHLLKTEAAHD